MAEKHETQIVVTEQKVIHTGTNRSNGSQYTIYQLIATNRNGDLIDQNLRSFEELPKNQLITVTVEKYESTNYGLSYTVSLKGKKSGLGAKVAKLESEVKALAAKVAGLEQRVNGASPPATTSPPGTQAGPPATPPPTPPPAQPQPAGDGMPGDDVPF